MTTAHMIPLLDHPDGQGKQLAEHYGELFDACSDYACEVNGHGVDSNQADEAYQKLLHVMDSQPNVG